MLAEIHRELFTPHSFGHRGSAGGTTHRVAVSRDLGAQPTSELRIRMRFGGRSPLAYELAQGA